MKGLPVISSCDELDCFYNRGQACHAPAINVGATHPKCDTFTKSGNHIARQTPGHVGACHVAACRHNSELTCSAPAIVVRRHGDHPDCDTFEKRS
jgi:hypothetical protein